ncbi:hypothetical protein C8R43DRAFT_1142829 [Mycena crocata]|nr:hypothetical protein C8R43DRAFT_1142829 [Mycena crocata]
MSSRQPDVWDLVLNAPTPTFDELAADFPNYSWDASDWRDDGSEQAPYPARSNAKMHTQAMPAPETTLPGYSTFVFDTPTPNPQSLTPLSTSFGNNSHQPDTPSMALPSTPFPLRSSHVFAANQQFEDANDHADDVLATNQQFEAAHDHAADIAKRTEIILKRRGVAKGAEKENAREQGGSQKEGTTRIKSTFTGQDIIAITRATVDRDPFSAPHGHKAQAWQDIIDALLAQNFPHTTITHNSIQHKVETLVAYKKDPSGKHRNLSHIIGEGTSTSITMGALLGRLEDQFDASKDKSEEKKAQGKKKRDENDEGGNTIHLASMKTMGKHQRSPSPGSDMESDNTEDTTPTSRTAAVAGSSLDTINSDDDNEANARKSKSKRRRKMARRSTSSGADGLLALMKEENARRAKHDTRVADSLSIFVSDSREQKQEFTSILKQLVAKEDA